MQKRPSTFRRMNRRTRAFVGTNHLAPACDEKWNILDSGGSQGKIKDKALEPLTLSRAICQT
jgi:hypothetical protein